MVGIINVTNWVAAAIVTLMGFLISYMLPQMVISLYGIPRPADIGFAVIVAAAAGWALGHMLVSHVRDLYRRTAPAPPIARRQEETARRARRTLVLVMAGVMACTEPLNVDNSKETLDAHGMVPFFLALAVVGVTALTLSWQLKQAFIGVEQRRGQHT